MLRTSKFGIAIAMLTIASTGVVLSASVFASESVSYADFGNLENGKTIFEQGKGDVPACTSCHGMEGLGDDAMGTPRLAGQGFNFLVKQLQDFHDDKRKDETMFIMNTNAKGLSEQDKRDVAAFAASLGGPDKGSDLAQVKELGTVPVGQRHLGKALAQHGSPSRGIPACHSCHGFNGRGAFPVYPRLAGQRYVYLVNQLKKWRDGSRANDPMGQMREVAKRMSDDDIHNVATFLTNASRTTKGNARIPDQK
ncbi:MAG: c-type cytochrome [Gammaproteobacteria bacterium]|nr:c-type cytochrome [Gammaproteobacteria bacterium]